MIKDFNIMESFLPWDITRAAFFLKGSQRKELL